MESDRHSRGTRISLHCIPTYNYFIRSNTLNHFTFTEIASISIVPPQFINSSTKLCIEAVMRFSAAESSTLLTIINEVTHSRTLCLGHFFTQTRDLTFHEALTKMMLRPPQSTHSSISSTISSVFFHRTTPKPQW